MIVVADTGPLIALAKIDHLHLLHATADRVLIPDAVERELVSKPGEWSQGIEQAKSEWLEVIPCGPPSDSVMATTAALDEGERQAIALAVQESCDVLLIDDKKGRDAADSLGIPIIRCCRSVAHDEDTRTCCEGAPSSGGASCTWVLAVRSSRALGLQEGW